MNPTPMHIEFRKDWHGFRRGQEQKVSKREAEHLVSLGVARVTFEEMEVKGYIFDGGENADHNFIVCAKCREKRSRAGEFLLDTENQDPSTSCDDCGEPLSQ